jgi:hypothetical protein
LKRAEVVSQSFSPEVLLIFNREGQDKFARASSLYLKEHIAILLDNKIISAPVIQSANLREPVIQGNFTLKEAARLRDLLNAGALPVSLSLESISRVEAILGAQAWERIIQAGIAGFIAVAVFMVLYYLLPGVISVIALGLYVLFATAIFKSLGVTFSLPAIAGIDSVDRHGDRREHPHLRATEGGVASGQDAAGRLGRRVQTRLPCDLRLEPEYDSSSVSSSTTSARDPCRALRRRWARAWRLAFSRRFSARARCSTRWSGWACIRASDCSVCAASWVRRSASSSARRKTASTL